MCRPWNVKLICVLRPINAPEAPAVQGDYRAHRLPRRVERVDLLEPGVGHLAPHLPVVHAQVDDEAEHGALRLVPDLGGQPARGVGQLQGEVSEEGDGGQSKL